jgi:hypothetical protein
LILFGAVALIREARTVRATGGTPGLQVPMVDPTPLIGSDKRKLRREFRRKGYRAVYLEVSGYPRGKREFAHVWLREKERSSDRRKRWTFALIVLGMSVVFAAYLAAVQLRWL